MNEKITVLTLREMKKKGIPIVALTSYDATFAKLLDIAGVDIILVGDSLGMVIQGWESTLHVTLEHMIYHCQAVSRGVKRAHLVVDMPFLTFQISPQEALRNAGRLISEGFAHAVKMEGGVRSAEAIKYITDAGIPVMGHIGLTPQSVHSFGGHKIQGRGEYEEEKIFLDAIAVEDAGAYSIVLEGIPKKLAKRITERVKIPTIGIGAGIHCNGQVLVIYDLLGMDESFSPKFLKKYENLSQRITNAVKEFCREVREKKFPDDLHSFE